MHTRATPTCRRPPLRSRTSPAGVALHHSSSLVRKCVMYAPGMPTIPLFVNHPMCSLALLWCLTRSGGGIQTESRIMLWLGSSPPVLSQCCRNGSALVCMLAGFAVLLHVYRLGYRSCHLGNPWGGRLSTTARIGRHGAIALCIRWEGRRGDRLQQDQGHGPLGWEIFPSNRCWQESPGGCFTPRPRDRVLDPIR